MAGEGRAPFGTNEALSTTDHGRSRVEERSGIEVVAVATVAPAHAVNAFSNDGIESDRAKTTTLSPACNVVLPRTISAV